MWNPLKFFSKTPEIRVELYAEITQRKSICETTVISVSETSITCKCKSLFVADNSFFKIREAYRIKIFHDEKDIDLEASLKSVDFCFEEEGFVLIFATNAKLFRDLQMDTQ